MKKYLDEALTEYGKSDMYPFHMPGHKRRILGEWRPEEIDITEIDGFDNLHHAEGIIREGQERLAELAGAEESFYLVNGSSGGILAAICGCVRRGDRILIGRNCHKAVYHAVFLMGLRAEYLYPEPSAFGIQGSIAPEQVRKKLKEFPDAAAVVIPSPTYDGVVSDIASVAAAVHEREIPLIVDEAHGAHFGFSGEFPAKALALGADLCIESLHKTLPSYTQTAVLHMRKGNFDPERVKRYLGIFQTSSPSYVFMAGMDRCVRMLQRDRAVYEKQETRKNSLFGSYEHRLRKFYERCESLQRVQVYPWFPIKDAGRGMEAGIWAKDNSKILISAQEAGMDGQQLYDRLREQYHLQMEMASGHYVTALTSLMDTEEGFERLYRALREMDEEAVGKPEVRRDAEAVLPGLYSPREKKLELAEAMEAEMDVRLWERAEGCISAEFVYLYPPGIPIVAPGELLTGQVIRLIADCRRRGLQVQGMQDMKGETIRIVSRR